MTSPSIIELLSGSRIIAVLRAPEASQYADVVDVLIDAGVTAIELTLTTPNTLDEVASLCEQFGDRASIGVGTVLQVQDAFTAIDAGAKFIVTPNLNPDIVAAAHERGVPILPGVLTPTEVAVALDLGVSAVKIFPAQTVGAGYLKHLRGPYPNLQGIPSGGVDLEGAQQWLAADAPAVSVGGPLLGDVFKTGDLDMLRAKAQAFVSALEGDSNQ